MSHCCVLEGTVGLNRAELHPVMYVPCGPWGAQAHSYPPASPQPAPALESSALACDCVFFGTSCFSLHRTNCILTELQLLGTGRHLWR